MSETNRQMAEKNENFRKLCDEAGVPATKRQASKYRLKKGAAFRFEAFGEKARLAPKKD